MKLRISVEDRAYDVDVDVAGESDADQAAGPIPDVAVPDSVLRPRPPQRLPEDAVVRSPIAGRVTDILAVPAQAIQRHRGVVLLDAMKMEVPIGPEVDGVIRAIHVAVGDPVATGQVLFEMEP